MNSKTSKTCWSVAGLFMITLILTLPFYSANALAASIQITKNQGDDGIRGFIDAQGDTWTVEATITGTVEQNIPPESVKLKIGQNEAPFQSCSAAALGTACEYISPLTDGVQEGEYPFQVVYNFRNNAGLADSVSNGEVIRADGSDPGIEFTHLQQNAQGQIELDFTVKDKVRTEAPAVGIRKIDIIDAESGNAVQSIPFAETGVQAYNYRNDGGFGGILQGTLSGEGLRRLKIHAEDWLGHQSTDAIRSFELDTVQPAVLDSLNLTGLGRFMGTVIVTTDIEVDVQENNLLEVAASSDQASLQNSPADCEEDTDELGLWHCRWQNVEVLPEATVALSITAKDRFGNTATRLLSQSFVQDTSPPEIEFFGTERTFESRNYVQKAGTHRIILSIREQGAGMNEEGIRANLLALGRSSSEAPTACEQAAETFNCYWEVQRTFTSSGVARIGLSRFQDRVGNQGQLQEMEVFIDDAGPAVEKLEVVGVSDVGEKNYFQSNDRLKIEMKAVETTGLVILVNVNNVVNDARTLFPETVFTRSLSPRDGWQVFTEDSCTREEGRWICEVATEPIKSGPQSGVKLEIRVQDTAGNDAASWPADARNAQRFSSQRNGPAEYFFDLLGLTEEENPDYWEVGRVVPLVDVDLDVVELMPSRAPVRFTLRSDNGQAQVRGMDLLECVPEEGTTVPEISRALLQGSNFPEGTASPVSSNIIIEFSPFNGRQLFGISEGTFEKATALYTCRVLVYSSIGRDALRSAEIQDVQVEVNFAFSTLGAIDENIAQRIRDVKDSSWYKFTGAFSYIDKALRWINYLLNWLQIIVIINEFVNLFADGLRAFADTTENTGILAGLGALARGSCLVADKATHPMWKVVEYIQIPIGLLSCNPDPGINLGWYGYWQRGILRTYNIASGREILGIPASSLYENMYISSIGLCVPGIAYNLNKARELQCRKIICYGREVPQGIATIEACNELYNLQMCEFVYGPFVDLSPLGAIAAIGRLIQSALTSPLGLIKLAEVVGCSVICFQKETKGAMTVCKVLTGINKVVKLMDLVASGINNRPDITGSPYCSIADDINVDELVGQVQPAQGGPPLTQPQQPAEEPTAEPATSSGQGGYQP